MRTLGRDFVGVPFAARLRHRVDLRHIDDGAGAVGRIGPFVEDVDLVADLGVDLRRLVAANEDAAVGVIIGPELGLDLEILVRLLADEIGGILALGDLVRNQRPVFHRPIGFADLGPVAHLGAVDERHPAIALAGRDAGKLKCGRADQQTGRKYRQALHERSPPMAAFSWTETYHRGAWRKSDFHAAVALCGDISLSATADHACAHASCSAGTRPASIATTEMSASEPATEETMKAIIRSWRYLMT